MKNLQLLLTLFFVMIGLQVFTQNHTFYNKGELIALNEKQDTYTLKFMNNEEEQTLLNSEIPQEEIGDLFYKVTCPIEDLSNVEFNGIHPVLIDDQGFEHFISDQLCLRWKSTTDAEQKLDLISTYGLQLSRSNSVFETYLSSDIINDSKLIYETGLVDFCSPDLMVVAVQTEYIPTDPYFQNQWNLLNTGLNFNDNHTGAPGADIEVTNAWDITFGIENVIVAVLDAGFPLSHPDLPVDRYLILPESNISAQNDNITGGSSDSHGIACAGIIGAEMDNGIGIAGIAPECIIMPIKIPLSGDPATYSIRAEGIIYAVDNGANIISNSWSVSSNLNLDVIEEALQHAVDNDVIPVFSSANTGANSVSYPANSNIQGVVGVSGSDRFDNKAVFSSYGSQIDIAAPTSTNYSNFLDYNLASNDIGVLPYYCTPLEDGDEGGMIWTLDLVGADGYNPFVQEGYTCNPVIPNLVSNSNPYGASETLPNTGPNFSDYTARFTGVSASCPQVAAVLALMRSVNPCLSVTECYNLLTVSADEVGNHDYDENGFSLEFGYGRLNAFQAVLAACEYEGETYSDCCPNMGATLNVTQPFSCPLDLGSLTFTLENPENSAVLRNENNDEVIDLDMLEVGLYRLFVTSSNGCVKCHEFIVEYQETYLSAIETVALVEPSCPSNADGQISVQVVSVFPYTIQWLKDGEFIEEESSETLLNIEEGFYEILIVDECGGMVSESWLVQSLYEQDIQVALVNETAPICPSSEDGTLNIEIISFYNYTIEWFKDGNLLFAENSQTLQNIGVGLYEVSIEDECGGILTDSWQLDSSYAQGMEVNLMSDIEPSCPDSEDGLIEIEVISGYSYSIEWSLDGTILQGENNQTLQNVGIGLYEVSIEDECGGILTDSWQLDSSYAQDMEVNLISNIEPSCPDSEDGLIEIEVISGYSYSIEWYLNGTLLQGENNQTLQNIGVGSYEVSIEDECGGILTDSWEIGTSYESNLNANIIVIQPELFDDNGQITFEASGGLSPYTYYLNDVEVSSENNNLSAGEYHILVIDVCGSEFTETVTLQDICSADLGYEIGELISEDVQNVTIGFALANPNYFNGGVLYFDDDLTFEEDVTMTISDCDFVFAEETSLIIEHSADIEFINCTFTSCDVWEGIRIHTNPLASTKVEFSGEGTENCIIEYAKDGILSNDVHGNLNNPSFGKLNLTANNVSFINNRRAVKLLRVKKVSDFIPQLGSDELYPAFIDCFFTVNDDYKENMGAFQSHAYYGGVRGCNFESVFMTNEISDSPTWASRGIGILSTSSNFHVENEDIDNPFSSRFSGLNQGISIRNGKKKSGKYLYGITVLDAIFERNKVGIYSLGGRQNTFARNTFTMGETMTIDALDDDWTEREGIVMAGDINFQVQQNTFTNVGAIQPVDEPLESPATIGIRVRDNRWASDMVRNNVYHELSVGNLANGSNRQPDFGTADDINGLRFLCNDHFNSLTDVQVAESTIFDMELSPAEIAQEQKEIEDIGQGFDETVSAGNLFTSEEDSDVNYRNSGTAQINYYWMIDSENPGVYNPTFDDDGPLDDYPADNLNICQIKPLGNKVVKMAQPTAFLDEHLATQASAEEGLGAVKYIYLAMIDDGDTEELKDEVDFSWSEDVWQMRDKLLNVSPFVSPKVAYGVADKTDVFPHAIAFEVFSQNPGLLKDNKFINYLATKTDPMPEHMLGLLYLARDEENLRTELENQINTFSLIKNQAEDDLLRAYNALGDHEAVKQIMEDRNCTLCDIYLIEEAMSTGDMTTANTYLANLQEKGFIKDPVSTTEINQYNRWFTLYAQVLAENRSWAEVTPSEQAELEELAFQYFFTAAGKNAITVLEEITENSYFIPPAYGGGDGFEFRGMEIEKELSEQAKIQVYPNPADHLINFELDYTKSLDSPDLLVIRDVNGKLVHTEQVKNAIYYFVLNTNDWSSGSYYYEVLSQDKLLESGKIEIIH